MIESVNPGFSAEPADADGGTKTGLVVAGGIVGAILASSCCIVPLVLFMAGLGGAWVGNLTALAPYKPLFLALTVGFLGYGYWLVYRQSKAKCAEGEACARPLPNRLVKSVLVFATVLAGLSFAWPVIVPILLG